MRAFALLLALSAPATGAMAERVAVPRGTHAATQLQTALDRCKAAAGAPDRCFDLQIALSAALVGEGDAVAAQQLADTARRDLQAVWSDADDTYIAAQSQAQRAEATAADKAAYARATAEWRRLWLDQAIASEAEGAAEAARGRHRGAADAYGRAVSIRESYGDGPANRNARIRAAASAAVALAGAESFAAGEKAIRRVLGEARKIHGDAHPLVAGIKLDLADILAARTAFAEAGTLYDEARAILRRDPAAAIEADTRYARFLVRADRKREAEPLARDILASLLAARANEARIATAYLDLAAIVPLADGLPLAERAVALRTKRLGDKHLETARATIAYARLLERAGAFAEAEQLRRPALIVIQTHNMIQHPETAAAYLELGENLIRQGRPADAERVLPTALRAFDESAGPESAGATRAAMLLAMTRFVTGSEDPRPLVLRAMPVIRRTLDVTHSERLQAEFILAMIVYHAERNVPAALRQIRLVTDAGLQRARSYPDYGPDAQFEMRQIAPAFTTHVRFAWDAAQLQAQR